LGKGEDRYATKVGASRTSALVNSGFETTDPEIVIPQPSPRL